MVFHSIGRAHGNAANPEVFSFVQKFPIGKYKIFLKINTGGSKYIQVANGEFPVMADLQIGTDYTMPLRGKVSFHDTGVNSSYPKLVPLDPEFYVPAETSTLTLTYYPSSLMTILASDYAIVGMIE